MFKSFAVKRPVRKLSAKSSGFTLLEILIVMAVIAILTAIAYPAYNSYIDKAKVTVGISTLETVRKTIEEYHVNYGYYPPALDISNGQDGTGKTVLPTVLLYEFTKNLSSFESYTIGIDDYTLTARANDTNHSLLVLKSGSVVIQGP